MLILSALHEVLQIPQLISKLIVVFVRSLQIAVNDIVSSFRRPEKE
jgi:hypothetical protein